MVRDQLDNPDLSENRYDDDIMMKPGSHAATINFHWHNLHAFIISTVFQDHLLMLPSTKPLKHYII